MAKKSNAIPFEEAVKILARMSPAQIEAALARAIPGRVEDMPNDYFINQGGDKYTTASGPYTPPAAQPAVNPEAPNINPAYANSAVNITSPGKPSIAKAKFVPTTNPAEVPAVNKPVAQPVVQSTVQTPTAQSQTTASAYTYNPNLPDVYYMHQPDGTVVQVNNKTGQTTAASGVLAGIGNAMLGKKA